MLPPFFILHLLFIRQILSAEGGVKQKNPHNRSAVTGILFIETENK